MAGTRVTSGTLVASTVATVSFTVDYQRVWITNSGSTAIYVRTDGVAPTVAGDDCYVVLPSSSLQLPNGLPKYDQAADLLVSQNVQTTGVDPNPGTVVKLISTGTPTYTVAGL